MSTAKHYSFCSGPMHGKSVTDLPGIGDTYAGRLRSCGIYMASDIYEKFKSLDFDSQKCQNWLSRVCSANSRYSSMCYQALREWHEQFGETRCSPRRSNSSMRSDSDIQFSPLRPLEKIPLLNNSPVYTPQTRNLSPANPVATLSATRNSDTTKAEVMKIIVEFQKKQDAMAARINVLEQEKSNATTRISKLEQEKSKSNEYVKALEARIKQMDRSATDLQKQLNTRVEQYKNVSSSIYLVSQKLDELLAEESASKQISLMNNSIKSLESRIEIIEENANNIQKRKDKKISNKNKDANTRDELNKSVLSSIDTLSKKFGELIKKQNKPKQENSSINETLETRIEKIENELRVLAVDIRNLKENGSKSKKLDCFNANQPATTSKQTPKKQAPACPQNQTKAPSKMLDEIVDKVNILNQKRTNSTTNNNLFTPKSSLPKDTSTKSNRQSQKAL